MQNKNQLRTQNAKENLGRQAKEISSQHVNFWAELEEKVGIYVVKHDLNLRLMLENSMCV